MNHAFYNNVFGLLVADKRIRRQNNRIRRRYKMYKSRGPQRINIYVVVLVSLFNLFSYQVYKLSSISLLKTIHFFIGKFRKDSIFYHLNVFNFWNFANKLAVMPPPCCSLSIAFSSHRLTPEFFLNMHKNYPFLLSQSSLSSKIWK